MSFLTKTARPASALTRVFAAQTPRAFTTSFAAHKTATETVKSGLKSVDRAVSDKVVDGIDAAVAAGNKAKEMSDNMGSKAEGKAAELKGEAKGAAAHAKGKAKGAADEVKGKL